MKTHVNRRRFCRACTLPFLAFWPGQQLCQVDIIENNAAVDLNLRAEAASSRAHNPAPRGSTPRPATTSRRSA
jgi:hypothetical protein